MSLRRRKINRSAKKKKKGKTPERRHTGGESQAGHSASNSTNQSDGENSASGLPPHYVLATIGLLAFSSVWGLQRKQSVDEGAISYFPE